MHSEANIVLFSGGVGGAKLALGFAHSHPAKQLTVVANTADDFEHWGLAICPDLDTVMYTLAGLSNTQQGWGLADETWSCMAAMQQLGGETWFRLGDKDIATHLLRTQLLHSHLTLTQVTTQLSSRLGIALRLLPMCNEKVRTIVHSNEGDLPFQQYFVQRQCAPQVSGFSFAGIAASSMTEEIMQAIEQMHALVVCPSNPFVSIAPILAVNGLKSALLQRNVPRVVVSPIVGGVAIKGPAAKMMAELKLPVTALEVARYYQDFATHFVLDSQDAHYQVEIERLGMQVLVMNTVMHSLQDKQSLAGNIIANVGL